MLLNCIASPATILDFAGKSIFEIFKEFTTEENPFWIYGLSFGR